VLTIKRSTTARPVTFESKVAEYLAVRAAQVAPIPGLVSSSSLGAMRRADCVLLDLGRVATTEPNAPFNVPNNGAYRFNDLAPGEQSAAGIPFRVIDPAQNGGKSLVVLNGAHACADLPREIDVPVGQRGRFLCVLGNVTGWEPDDPGVETSGAVAEYVIRYEDGSTQTIPLIQRPHGR